MLFQLLLIKFFKSEMFLYLPKVDHVIKSCKEPFFAAGWVSLSRFVRRSISMRALKFFLLHLYIDK